MKYKFILSSLILTFSIAASAGEQVCTATIPDNCKMQDSRIMLFADSPNLAIEVNCMMDDSSLIKYIGVTEYEGRSLMSCLVSNSANKTYESISG